MEAVEIAGAGKDGKKNESKYLKNLVWVPCIQYPITFWKKSVPMLVLLDLGSKVNAIYPTFAKELGLSIRLTDVRVQKINNTTLDTFGIIVAAFSVMDKTNRVRFLEKTFLVANISLKIVLEMPFPTLSGVDIDLLDRKLQWRTYTTKEAFPTTKFIELVDKKKFAAILLDLESENFVVHVASLGSDALPSFSPLELNVHPSCRPQVSGLIAKEAPIKIFAKYLDFVHVFFLDLAFKLLEHIKINNHAIKQVNNQQPPYGPIYSLGPIELETLKAYIKTNLANGFIRLSKSPVGAPILFKRKSDGSLRLYVNYQDFNNLTIKN